MVELVGQLLVVLQFVKIIRSRCQGHKTSCVNNACRPHRHTFRADKIQITADFISLYGVYRALHINLVLHQVDQIGRVIPGPAQAEIHVGDVALGNLVILEPVNGQIHITVLYQFLGIDIVHA